MIGRQAIRHYLAVMEAETNLHEMTFKGDNSSFRLLILRYQFPNIHDDEWDSNWLVVQGRVCLDSKEWVFRDPCLTTFEAARLADWLGAIARGEKENDLCCFIEPNLQFDRQANNTVRISFALEAAPPWAAKDDFDTTYDFEVPIGPELTMAARSLRQQLSRFPRRGTLGGAIESSR